jgi:ribosomal protein S18 acetylase RimI-like enzyme
MRVVEAETDSELAAARTLIEEYASSLEVDLEFQGYREEIAEFPGAYAAPRGAVLLAYEGDEAAGVVALRPHGASVCEMKRLYVRPAHRGKGIGRALSEAVIRRAVSLGYATMRLDTLPTMASAIGLYRELGFREIPPYRFNPVAGARYMELELPRR